MDLEDVIVIILIVFILLLSGSEWFGSSANPPTKISFEGHEYLCFRTFVLHNPDCKCHQKQPESQGGE